jgi:hypothetical protein
MTEHTSKNYEPEIYEADTPAGRFMEELKEVLQAVNEKKGIDRVLLLPAERAMIELVGNSLNPTAIDSKILQTQIAKHTDTLIAKVRSNTKQDFSLPAEGEDGIRPQVLIATYALARTRQLHYQKMPEEERTPEQAAFLRVAHQALDTLDQAIGKGAIIPASPDNPISVNEEIYNGMHTAYAYVSQHIDLEKYALEDLKINDFRAPALDCARSSLIAAYGSRQNKGGLQR